MDEWVKLNQPGEQTSSALMGIILIFNQFNFSFCSGKDFKIVSADWDLEIKVKNGN